MRRLELGSGRRPTDGYEHLDVNGDAPHVEHVADAFDELPFADETFAELRAVDLLEHCSYRNAPAVLAEWARVTAPGGRLFVQVPDAETIMRWFAADHPALRRWENGQACSTFVGAQWRLLGGHGDGRFAEPELWWANAHNSLWSRETLTDALAAAEFSVERLDVNGHPNLQVRARRRARDGD